MAEPAAVPRPGVQRGQRHPGPGAGRVAPTPPPPFPPCFPWGTGAGPPCASPGGRAAWRRRGAGVRPGSDGGVAVTPWGGLGLTGRPRRTGRLRHCSGNAEPWPSSEAVYPGSQARGVGGAQECGAGPWAAHSRDTWAAEPAGLAVPSGQGVPAPAPLALCRQARGARQAPETQEPPWGPGPGQAQVRSSPHPALCVTGACLGVLGCEIGRQSCCPWDGWRQVMRPACLQSGSQVDPARPCPVPRGGGSADCRSGQTRQRPCWSANLLAAPGGLRAWPSGGRAA